MRPAPRYTTRFVGRESEMRGLGRGLEPGAVLGVVGPGGVGKTRLVAESLRAHRAPVAFVDAAAARDADRLVGAVLRDLGATAAASGPLASAVAAASQVRVLVLDNLEQLGADAVEVVSALAGPERSVVYTSRVALGVPGERRLDVEPLRDPGLQLDVLLGAAARPDLDRAEVEPALTLFDGLPLALELAAGRLAVLSVDELIARSRAAPLELLRDPSRPAARGTTLWDNVAWSHALLDPASADALVRLGAFEGPVHPDLAAAFLGDALPLVVLAAWHLLRPGDDGRAEWLASVHAYARSRLLERPDRDEVFAAHDDVVLAFLQRHGSSSPADVAAAWSVVADADAVIERGWAPGAGEVALRRARQVQHCLHFVDTGRLSWQAYDARLGRLCDAGPPDAHSLPFLQKRYRHWLDVDRPRAVGYVHALRAEAARLDHPRFRWVAAYLLLHDASERDDAPALLALHDEALALARAHGLHQPEAATLVGPVNDLDLLHGDFAAVEERARQALALADRHLGSYQRATVYMDAALGRVAAGDWVEALARLAPIRDPALGVVPAALTGTAAFALLAIAVGRDGGADRAAVRALRAELGPGHSPADHARAELLDAVSARLHEGRVAGPLDAWERPFTRGHEHAAATYAALRALDGASASVPPLRSDPVSQGLARGVAAVRAVVAGDRAAAAVDLGPGSLWTHVVRRLLERAESERFGTWVVAGDGSWFEPPGGPRVGVAGAGARLLAALASAREPLGVDALAAAGWPGEAIVAAARGNRVRVVLASLRRAGVGSLRWARGQGWWLQGPLRRVDPG